MVGSSSGAVHPRRQKMRMPHRAMALHSALDTRRLLAAAVHGNGCALTESHKPRWLRILKMTRDRLSKRSLSLAYHTGQISGSTSHTFSLSSRHFLTRAFRRIVPHVDHQRRNGGSSVALPAFLTALAPGLVRIPVAITHILKAMCGICWVIAAMNASAEKTLKLYLLVVSLLR